MRMGYCPNCAKTTGNKRALGWGTLFACILTCGLWLPVIPFYPTRCVVCGSPAQDKGFWGKSGKFILAVLLLLPLTVLVILSGFIISASLSPAAAPFIYSLF